MQILIIDDDYLIRMMVHALFGGLGHTVIPIATAEEAIAYGPTLKADVVLLDLDLPRMSGLEVLTSLKTCPGWERRPILMLTADDSVDSLTVARRGGARGYICKPVQPETLLSMVVDVVEQSDLMWMDDYTRVRKSTW